MTVKLSIIVKDGLHLDKWHARAWLIVDLLVAAGAALSVGAYVVKTDERGLLL